MEELVFKYLEEAAAFRKGALETQKTRPPIFLASLANKLFSFIDEFERKGAMASDNSKPTINGALNHLKLAYGLLQREYPHFLKKI